MADSKENFPVIKDYEIEKVIGKGGCGIVYLAFKSRTEEKVAIKLHRGENSKEDRFRDQLLQEAIIWNRLSHPHIVKFLEIGFTNKGKLFVVSDFIQGKNLKQAMAKKQFSLEQVLKLSIEMCDALAYLHSQSIIHLDIKPSNILLDDAGNAFLSDFGFSITSTGKSKTSGGTPGYMSPEQERGDKQAITHKSDIYSLGIVIKELLGKRTGPTTRRTIRSDLKISDASPKQTLSDLEQKAIRQLEDLLAKALHEDQDARYGGASEMQEILNTILNEYFASSPSLSNDSQIRKRDDVNLDSTAKGSKWTSRIHDHIAIFDTFNEEEFQLGLKIFSKLMGHLVDLPEETPTHEEMKNEDFFQAILKTILDSDKNERSVIIKGAPGTGKSSLLGMLAIATRRILLGREGIEPNVDYVNIHDLDEICRGDYDLNKEHVKKRIAEIVKSIAQKFNGNDGILFIDGLERHKRDRVPETQSIFINQCKSMTHIKILGVGEYDGIEHAYDENERNAEKIPFSGTTVKLRAVPKRDFSKFCTDFVEFHKYISSVQQSWREHEIDSDTLYKRISALNRPRIDLLRMDIIYVADDTRSLSLTSAMESYCERQFEKQLSEGTNTKEDTRKALQDAAECVFQMFVSKNQDTSKRYDIRCWGFVTGHPAIRNFLIAKHIIHVLYEIGGKIKRAPNQPKGKSGYDYVKDYLDSCLDSKLYPSEINDHCKYFLNSERLDNVMIAFDKLLTAKHPKLSPTSTIHLCYLVGRVRARQRDAHKLLKDFIKNLSKRGPTNNHNSRDEMMLLECTYTISEICLEPENSHIHTEKFLSLLNDKDWATNAIAFHLMYYGDHDFDFSFPKSFRMVPGDLDYRRTLDTIGDRILTIAQTEDGWYPLFDIDVAIVCLLLISRQGVDLKRSVESLRQCKDRARLIIEKARDSTNSRINSRPIIPFLKFALAFSSRREVTDVFDIVTKFYECKYDTQRAGWLNKLCIEGRIESVADHSWGAMILAEIILPEQLSDSNHGSGYSKAEVIRSLLIHDLAESYTGDRPADNPGQEFRGIQRREELDFVELISFLRISDSGQTTGIVFGLERLVERWKSVENRSDLNGKIANFFDKCDAFIQFVVYSKYFFEQARRDGRSQIWRQFFDILKREFNSSVEGIEFLRNTSVRILSWGARVFDSDKPYLPHDEIFSDYEKYYPGRNANGVLEKINYDTHNAISIKRENTSRDPI
jgi:serine/threonine protein kinase/5'-deoxynucleotidase YfbR-like HD superfamily hydrolase